MSPVEIIFGAPADSMDVVSYAMLSERYRTDKIKLCPNIGTVTHRIFIHPIDLTFFDVESCLNCWELSKTYLHLKKILFN